MADGVAPTYHSPNQAEEWLANHGEILEANVQPGFPVHHSLRAQAQGACK